MRRIERYLPAWVRESLGAGTELGGTRQVTALSADVSGFTALGEALVREHGPQDGVELLAERIEGVFNVLVDAVLRQGGTVVEFAGDSVTAVFEGDDGSAAATAALLVVESDLPGAFGVRVRIGLGAGEVVCAVLGDESMHQVPVVFGAATRDAVSAQVRAAPEVVACSESFCAHAGGHVEILGGALVGARSVVTLAPRNPPPVREQHARRFFEPRVIELLRSSHSATLEELREAVPCFVGFELPARPDGVWMQGLARWSSWLQSEASRFGGTLLGVSFGDRFGAALITFGVPTGYSDNGPRAAGFALAVRSASGAVGGAVGPMRVGMASGRMRVGSYGGLRRRTYGVLGDSVNLAARLMQSAARDQILVSGRLARQLMGRFAPVALGHSLLRGRHQTVEVYELPAARTHSSGPAPIVPAEASPLGRKLEMTVLENAVRDATTDGFRAVLLEGEAGIGKTHLLLHLRQVLLADDGWLTLGAWGDPISGGSPWSAWRGAVLGLLDLKAETLSARQVVDALAGDERAIALASLLGPVLGITLADSMLTTAMTHEVRAANTTVLIRGLVERRLRGRKLALVVDDLHWFDSASWTLLHALLGDGCALLVAGSRPFGSERNDVHEIEMDRLRQLDGLRTLSLGPIERQAVEGIILESVGASSVDDDVVRLVMDTAGGHPLFTQELVWSLRDAGHLVTEGRQTVPRQQVGPTGRVSKRPAPAAGHCRLDAARGAIKPPASVEAAIAERLDRLEPSLVGVAKAASVLGRHFDLDTLAGILKSRPGAVRARLLSLSDVGLVQHTGTRAGALWSFRHAITQAVIYGSLPREQRVLIHGDAAAVLESLPSAEQPGNSAILAQHLERAGQWSRAAVRFDRAAADALGAGAYHEAVEFVERARNCEQKVRDPLVLASDRLEHREATRWRMVGDAHFGLGRIVDATDHLEQALGMWGSPVPRGGLGVGWGLMRELGVQLLHRFFPRTCGRSRDSATALSAANAASQLVPCYFIANALPQMLWATLRGLNLAESASAAPRAPLLTAELLASMSVVGAGVRAGPVARHYRRLATAIARREDDVATLARVLQVTALFTMGSGELDDADQAMSEALVHYEELGDNRRWEETAGAQAWLYLYQGRFDDGLRLWEQIWESARRRDDRHSMAVASVGQADHLLRLDGPDQAGRVERLLERCAPLLPDHDDPIFEIHHAAVGAELARRRDEPERARELALKALGSIEKADAMAPYGMEVYGFVADVVVAVAALDPAGLRESRRALKPLKRYARTFAIGKPRYLRARATLLLRRGNITAGRQLLNEAQTVAEQLGMAWEASAARDALAQLPGASSEAGART